MRKIIKKAKLNKCIIIVTTDQTCKNGVFDLEEVVTELNQVFANIRSELAKQIPESKKIFEIYLYLDFCFNAM